MDNWFSTIGAIASIFGAFWALYQANKAKKSAKKAEQMRDELIQHRELVELSQVHSETTRILKIVSKVGPSCSQSQLRGINCSNIAKDVEEYSRFINEQSSHFSEHFDNKAKDLCKNLAPDIEALSEAKSFEDKKKWGKSIYYKINNFMPTVKDLSDKKKESVAKT